MTYSLPLFNKMTENLNDTLSDLAESLDDSYLPPTKIKRSYKCSICQHSTVNPRLHLKHRIDLHGHKLKIVECPYCVYACQYRQKLNRHMRLVHRQFPNQPGRGSIQSSHSSAAQKNSHSPANHSMDISSQNYPSMFENLHAIASQMTPFKTPNDGPIDLSFPTEVKQIIRFLDSQHL